MYGRGYNLLFFSVHFNGNRVSDIDYIVCDRDISGAFTPPPIPCRLYFSRLIFQQKNDN